MIVRIEFAERFKKIFFEEIRDNQDMDENTTIGASDYSDR